MIGVFNKIEEISYSRLVWALSFFTGLRTLASVLDVVYKGVIVR